jgi:DNA-directed RNA polymerase specialized sigma24 family protein
MNGIKEQLTEAVQARKEAEARYRRLIMVAREKGWTNEEIARVCGVTEAAIRMYRRRHPELKMELISA